MPFSGVTDGSCGHSTGIPVDYLLHHSPALVWRPSTTAFQSSYVCFLCRHDGADGPLRMMYPPAWWICHTRWCSKWHLQLPVRVMYGSGAACRSCWHSSGRLLLHLVHSPAGHTHLQALSIRSGIPRLRHLLSRASHGYTFAGLCFATSQVIDLTASRDL